MNDPHVVALFYNIEHGNTVNYDEANPLVVEESAFRLEVADKKASFFLKDHHAQEDEALGSIEEYIRTWEFDACLNGGPDYFKLNFERAEIVDRNPQPSVPGIVEPSPVTFRPASASVAVSKVVSRYPSPPNNVVLNPDVQTMFDRFMGYRRGHEPITGMAYFCHTFIMHMGKGSAAEHFQISKKVLKRIRKLSSKKGGPSGARKHNGIAEDLTTEERQFLDEAIRTIIHRVAEKARTPEIRLTQITLSDLQQSQ